MIPEANEMGAGDDPGRLFVTADECYEAACGIHDANDAGGPVARFLLFLECIKCVGEDSDRFRALERLPPGESGGAFSFGFRLPDRLLHIAGPEVDFPADAVGSEVEPPPPATQVQRAGLLAVDD